MSQREQQLLQDIKRLQAQNASLARDSSPTKVPFVKDVVKEKIVYRDRVEKVEVVRVVHREKIIEKVVYRDRVKKIKETVFSTRIDPKVVAKVRELEATVNKLRREIKAGAS